jgi:4'-phosphopantetheinyl transferase EntD
VIEKIVPATAACAEAFTDPPDPGLFPQEAALLAGAAAGRRREFATARSCARRALADLGVTPAPVLRGERGEPRWPPGIVGSITHCAGYRAAVVARATDVPAIGVDAEPGEPLPDGVLGIVSGPGERERLRHLAAAAPGTCWDRLLFSAKESVYKAWFPLTGRWLGFEDVDLSIDPGGTFAARPLPGAARAGGSLLTGFAGRWLASDGLILTAVTGPPPAAGRCNTHPLRLPRGNRRGA